MAHNQTHFWFSRFLAIALCSVPVIAAVAPRGLALAPAIIGLFAFITYRPCFGHWPRLLKLSITVALGVVGIMALSIIWAQVPQVSLDRTLDIAPLMLGLVLLTSVVKGAPPQLRTDCVRFFPVALIITAVIIMMNLYANNMIYGLTRPPEEMPSSTNFSHLNRSIVAFAFLAIMALGVSVHQGWNKRQTIITILLCGLGAAIIIKTHSQSAQMAVIIAAIVALCLPYRWPKTWIVIAAGIAFAMIAAPWIAQWGFASLAEWLDHAPWIQDGYAANRLEIWNFVSHHALQKPWLGYGVESTRVISDFQSDMLYHKNDHVLHPHNFVIQLWIEFGLLGVVSAALAIAGILHLIWKDSSVYNRRMKTILLLTVIGVSAAGYGFWQSWWQGLLIYTAAMAIIFFSAQPKAQKK